MTTLKPAPKTAAMKAPRRNRLDNHRHNVPHKPDNRHDDAIHKQENRHDNLRCNRS